MPDLTKLSHIALSDYAQSGNHALSEYRRINDEWVRRMKATCAQIENQMGDLREAMGA